MTSHSIGSLETFEPEDKSFSKHILTEGCGEDTPNEGAICTVKIVLVGDIDTEGVALGEYNIGEECEITVGEGDCPLADLFDKVVCSMKENETSYIKSKIDINGQKITELDVTKTALKFNLTLKLFSRAANPLELEQDERLDRAQHHKDCGTALYQAANMTYAVLRFQRALHYLRFMDSGDLTNSDIKQTFTVLRCQCLLNLAACFLKTGEQDGVVENCCAALQLQPGNVKGLFRRGQAYLALQDYDAAKADLTQAKTLDPTNKAVVSMLRTVEAAIKKEKQMYKNMFSS